MQLQFDANTVDPTQGPEVWPLGDYPLEITKDEVVPVKDDPSSAMLVLTLTCIDGPFRGKTHPYRLNIFNANTEAQRIAYQQLSALCHATGRIQISDTSQLVGARFIATIGPQKNNPQYSEVKRVKDMQGNEPGKKSNSGPATAAPAPSYTAGPQAAAPAYAQPGPAPTPAAPAAPAGGWQQPGPQLVQQQPAPAPAAAPQQWGGPQQQQQPAAQPVGNQWGVQQPQQQVQQQYQPQPAAPTQPAVQQPRPAPVQWRANADPNAGAAAPPWAGGQPHQ
jgi:hypothetical protein